MFESENSRNNDAKTCHVVLQLFSRRKLDQLSRFCRIYYMKTHIEDKQIPITHPPLFIFEKFKHFFVVEKKGQKLYFTEFSYTPFHTVLSDNVH